MFTAVRSTKEEPDSVPAASPRLRRSTSPWPPGDRIGCPPRSSPPPQTSTARVRTAPGPYPPDSSRCRLRDVNAGSSRTPLHLARRTRTIWQYWHVPALSGLLPPSPAPPGTRLPSATPPCCDRTAAKVSHLHSNNSASRRTRTWPKVNARRNEPSVEGAYAAVRRAGQSRHAATTPCHRCCPRRRPSRRLARPPSTRRWRPCRSAHSAAHRPARASPTDSASASTGTSPAADTRFGSSNTADVAARV